MCGLNQSLRLVAVLVPFAALGVAQEARAQTAQATPPAQTAQTTAASDQIQEVIVTAQKVQQNALDVPVAVTAIQSTALVDQALVQITDYYTRIPGLQIAFPPGDANGIAGLAIRGITTGGDGNPTIGVMIDGIPFGSTTSLGQPPFPDLDPAVLDRVETLRGPQGTLYGASSLGGLIDLVTKTPDLQSYLGHVQVGPETVDGGNTGWSTRGSANIPLINDHLALMVSGVYRDDPAWIDNAFNNTHNVNQVITRGGNAKLLIKPFDDLSITLSALAQHQTTQNGTGIYVCPPCAANPAAPVDFTPLYGQDTISTVPSNGFNTFELYSAKIEYNLGWAQLTSLSAWNQTQWLQNEDVTTVFSFLLIPQLYNLPGGRVIIGNQNESGRFTQELRLGSTGKQFDWLVGFYFNHERENVLQSLNLFDSSGASQGTPYDGAGPLYYFERAFFADLTWHFTPQIDLQVGGRYSWLDETYYTSQTTTGPAAFVFGPSSTTPTTTTSAHPVTWLFTPSYHLTKDLMAYFRAASGYRPGGPNTGVAGVPPSYAPDRVVSYELGLKGYATEDHSASFQVDVFQIDWHNLQLLDTNPMNEFTYFSNGSAAQSRGVELEATWKPWRGFTVSPNFTYTDAKLTQNLPPPSPSVTPLAGLSGDPLPATAKYTGNINVQQTFDLTATLSAYVQANYSYISSRWSDFLTNDPSVVGPRFEMPGFGQFDMIAGLNWTDSWRFNIYGRNLGDVRGVYAGTNRNGTSQPLVWFTQPRTIGFYVEYSFQKQR